MSVRHGDPETSHEAAASLGNLGEKVSDRILQLARNAGARGITLSDGVAAIPEHKPSSISPRFIKLVRRGKLIRVRTGTGKPSKRFPAGRPLYMTRLDEETRRRVLIHWVPEFAPVSAAEAGPIPDCEDAGRNGVSTRV